MVTLFWGCQTTAGPERRDLLGTWMSDDVPGVTIRLTVAETARAVEGAGAWMETEGAHAFQVSGAFATDELALHLNFAERADVTFLGFFQDEDTLEGTLSGGEFNATPVSFRREELVD